MDSEELKEAKAYADKLMRDHNIKTSLVGICLIIFTYLFTHYYG